MSDPNATIGGQLNPMVPPGQPPMTTPLPPPQPDFDLTQRKKPATHRGRPAAIHRSLYENAIEGIFRSTPEGRYLSANPALAQMLGYNSPEELIASIKDIGKQLCVD